MAHPLVGELGPEITNTVGVMASAKVLIDGFSARLQAGIDAALSEGATKEQLNELIDEVAAQKAGRDELATAVAANQGPGGETPVPSEGRRR